MSPSPTTACPEEASQRDPLGRDGHDFHQNQPSTLQQGELVLDLRAHNARFGNRRIALTRKEFGLLECLARHPGWVFSKERLLELVWGYEFGDARTVSVHIANLRRKLGESPGASQYIHTIKGAGYKLEMPAASKEGLWCSPSPPLPLVGREDELAGLLGAWESVERQRSGRAVLVTGEAGIGKTRLVQEFALRLQEKGTVVLWGRSDREKGRPDFLPWIHVVQSYLHSAPGRTLVPELGRVAGTLARLCPAVFPEPPLTDFPPESAHAARYRLCEAVTDLLRLACRKSGPLLLVLDDLHEADADSLTLVAHLARDLVDIPVLVTACYRQEQMRTNDFSSLALASLAREVLSQQMNLEGLDETGVGALLRAVSGQLPSSELTARILDETQGNPFFVMEHSRLLAAQEVSAQREAPTGGLPDAVRAAIEERLDYLHPRTRRVLEIASVVGREFSLAVLERASGESPTDLVESLGEANAAHIVERFGDRHGFRFVHHLVRQDLYESLELPNRIRLHGEIGDAVTAVAGAYVDQHLNEIAHHYLEASPVGWRAEALEFCLRAARAAASLSYWDEAGRHFENALAVLSLVDHGAAEDSLLAEIREGLADARSAAEPTAFGHLRRSDEQEHQGEIRCPHVPSGRP